MEQMQNISLEELQEMDKDVQASKLAAQNMDWRLVDAINQMPLTANKFWNKPQNPIFLTWNMKMTYSTVMPVVWNRPNRA